MPSSCCLRKDLSYALGTIGPMSWRPCGSWKVCGPSGTWTWVRRAQINLHHCSPGETDRGERAKSVANCCLSVKIVPSCRDIGEMQWKICHPCHHDIELAIVESFTAFLHGVLVSFGYHGTEPLLVHFCIFYGSIATMFAHLCLQLRSSTASWYRAYLACQIQESCFQFRTGRADASHWIVRCTFLGSDVNEWIRFVSLKRCDVCRWRCSGNIETWRFQIILL